MGIKAAQESASHLRANNLKNTDNNSLNNMVRDKIKMAINKTSLRGIINHLAKDRREVKVGFNKIKINMEVRDINLTQQVPQMSAKCTREELQKKVPTTNSTLTPIQTTV